MRLFFRDFNTTQFKILYTEETQLIQDLKHDIATILEIDTLNFFLIANGKILRDDLVISDYGLRDSTFLDVNLRILGGMEGQVARVASIRRTVLEKKNTTIIKKKSSNQDNKSFTMSTRFELMQKLENQIYGRQDESKEIKLSGVKSIKFSSTTNKFFVLALPSKIHIFDENGNNEIQSFERDGIIEIEPINQPEGLLYTLETQKIELYSLKSKSVIRVIEPEIKGRYTFIAAFQIFQESSFLVGSDTELSYDQFSMVNWQSVHTYEVPKCAFEIEKRSQRSPEKVKSIFKKKQAVVKFLTGHTSAQNYQGKITVKELSHSLNNKFAIIAKDNNIYLWNIETRTYVENFAIQNIEDIESVEISKDGKYIAVLGYEAQGPMMIRILDIREKILTSSIKNPEAEINCMTFLNSYSIITGSADGSVKVIDFIKLEETHNYKSHSREVTAISVNPNRTHFVTGSLDGTINVVRTEKKEVIERIKEAHKQPIYSIAITSDGQYLVSSGSWDGLITIWNMKSLSQIFTFHTSHELILCIALTKNNKYIISGANDGCVGVWDIAGRTQYHMFSGIQYEAIHALESTPDSKYIITGGTDRSVVILDIEKKTKVHEFAELHHSSIYAVKITRDGRLVLAAGGNSVAIIDINRKEVVKKIHGVQKTYVMTLAISADSKFFIAGGQDKSIVIYSLENHQIYHTFPEAHEGTITSINISPCGNYFVSGADDGSLGSFDLINKQEINHVKKCHQGRIETVLFSPDGKKIISCSRDKCINFYELVKEERIDMLEKAHDEWIYCLAISPDSSFLATGSGDRSIRLFSIDRKERIFMWENAHDGLILALAITRDNKSLISSSGDCCVKVFDLETKNLVHVFEYIHNGYIYGMTVSNDSRYVYTGAEDKCIKKLDLVSKEMVWEIQDVHDDKITALALTDNDEYLISSSQDRSLILFCTKTHRKIYHFVNVHGVSANCVCTFENKFIISGGGDKSLSVFDIRTRERVFFLDNIHEDEIVSVSIIPGTHFVATAGKDKQIIISDLYQQKKIFSLNKTHKDCIHAMRPTPDGRYLISVSRDMSIGIFLNPFPKNEITIMNDDTLSPYSRIGSMLLLNHFIKQPNQLLQMQFLYKFSKFTILPYNWNLLHIICICFPQRFLFYHCKMAKINMDLDNLYMTPIHYLFNYEKTDYTLVNDILGNMIENLEESQCLANRPKKNDIIIDSLSNILPDLFLKANPNLVANLMDVAVSSPWTFEGNEIPRFGSLKHGITHDIDYYGSFIMRNEIISEKIDENGTDVLQIKALKFKLDYQHVSNDMIKMIRNLRLVKHEQIFKTAGVEMIIEHLWIHSKPFYLFLLFFYSCLMILLSVLIGNGEPNSKLENAIIVISAFFLLYEFAQMIQIGIKTYFSELANTSDMVYFAFLISTMVVLKLEEEERDYIDGISRNWIRALCVFFGYIKWLYYFRVIKQTRSLIRKITEIMKDMVSFVIVILMIIFGFSLVFIEFNPSDSYSTKLLKVYQLLYANYDSPGDTISEIIFFVIVTFMLTIVLLNMLIAIMSDTYQRIKSSSILTDNLEKVELINEALIMQRAFCLRRFKKINKKNGKNFDRGYLFLFSVENFDHDKESLNSEIEFVRTVLKEEFRNQKLDRKRQIEESNTDINFKQLEESLKTKIEDLIDKENKKQFIHIQGLMENLSKKISKLEVNRELQDRKVLGLDRKLDNILTLIAGSPHVIQKLDMNRLETKTLSDI